MPSAESDPAGNTEIELLNPLVIDDWDSQLRHIPSATFFHRASWARVLHSTYGYEPVYFVTREGGKIRSLLPFMEVNSWLTGRRGVSLPFTDECDPIAAVPDSINPLLQRAQIHGQVRRWKSMEYRARPEALHSAPASKSYYNHSLQLNDNLTSLFAQLDGSTRRAIRKAEQSQLTVEFSQSEADIRTFYELLCRTRQRHGVPPQPFEFFSNIQRHVLAQNQGWIVLARRGKVAIAGAVFFHYRKGAIYKFGASDDLFQHLRANNLVMWAAIQRYASDGLVTLDFGRTAPSNEGLRRFKLSWGTQERRIEYLRQDLRINRFVPGQNETAGLFNRVCRITPRFVSRLAGSLLYKHIAIFMVTFAWCVFEKYS